MSNIQWTDETWNPVVGCTRASAGCDHCYAVTMSHRLEAMGAESYAGLTVLNDKGDRHFNGEVRCVEEAIDKPRHWRKPRRVFVNSMSDLFHPKVPFEFIDQVFAVMALCPQHAFQVLTKRPERMAEYLSRPYMPGYICDAAILRHGKYLHSKEYKEHFSGTYAKLTPAVWPLPNVWLGTSVENQAAADERIPHLLRCPAAVRFLSCEPLLGPIDVFAPIRDVKLRDAEPNPGGDGNYLHWVIVGGESGSKARVCDIGWIRSVVSQCKTAAVPCFVKQLGSRPVLSRGPNRRCTWGVGPVNADGEPMCWRCGCQDFGAVDGGSPMCNGCNAPHDRLKNKKGGDPAEWPEDLRVREMPDG